MSKKNKSDKVAAVSPLEETGIALPHQLAELRTLSGDAPALFDDDALDAATPAAPSLANLDLKQLLRLRTQIDALLPPRAIEQMNLEEEAVLQFHLAKFLMNETIASGAPANQKAQTVNTCTTILAQLAKTQTALYTLERVKIMENCLERAFEGAPTNAKQAFYDKYAAALSQQIEQKDAKSGGN